MPFLPLQNGWGRDSARVRGVPLAHNPDERKKLTCLRLSDAIVLLLFTIHGGDIACPQISRYSSLNVVPTLRQKRFFHKG